MKRILYFIPQFPRLTETFIEREVAKLSDSKHINLQILSLQRASGTTSEKVFELISYKRLDLLSAILALKFIFINPLGLITALHICLQDSSKHIFSRIYLFLKSVGYAQLMSQFNPDHIHAHFLSDPSTICLVASKILNIPYSISAHAKDVFITGTLISQKTTTAKFISICNNYAYQKCVELSGQKKPQNIYKIYHGVDEKQVLPRGKLTEKNPVSVIFVNASRLVEKKGVDYVIYAAKFLRERGFVFEVDIVGVEEAGSYQKYLNQVMSLGLDNCVFFPGSGKGLPFSEITKYYERADIFVSANVTAKDGDADGVPTVVIEAALAKIPIVATNAGSIADLIDRDSGVIVRQRDGKALADGIEFLLTNPDVSAELANNAYTKAKQMFDIDRNIAELERLFLK